MVKTVIFVNDHETGQAKVQHICQENKIPFGGQLTNLEQEIIPGLSYAASPFEFGFDNMKVLMEKFDEVIFVKDHDNHFIKILQRELEFARSDKKLDKSFPTLDKDKLNFFGCSHTGGIGHESIETSYPYVLSDLIGIPYNNFALPGEGNYSIEDLLNNFSIENSKLIIQLTDVYRIRYVDNGKLLHKKIYEIKNNFSNSLFLTEENLIFNFKNIVSRIINRLRDGHNKFIITYTYNYDNLTAIECNEFLYGFKEFSSFAGLQRDVAADNSHYGILTHRSWAEKLHEKWIELYEQK